MRLSAEESDETHTGLILLLYGYQESLRREEFVKLLCSNRCRWLLHGSLIRQRMENFDREEVL